jgi:hypothetical protein
VAILVEQIQRIPFPDTQLLASISWVLADLPDQFKSISTSKPFQDPSGVPARCALRDFSASSPRAVMVFLRRSR